MRGRARWWRVLVSASMGLALAGAAAVAGASEQGPVRIGIVPSQNVKVLVEQYQPLMDYLASKVGRPFELMPTKSYGEIVDRLAKGELDGGVLGSCVAEQALHELAAVPLARPEKGGVSTYRGFIIVRKDSGIRKIEDLKGKSFDYVDRNTSAGYVFPQALLRQKTIDPDAFFSKATFAGKHDVSVSKVLNRESDGASVKDTVYEKMAAADPRVNAELEVIHRSERFPEGTILLRRQMPATLAKAARQALLGASGDPAGKAALQALGADRYIETRPADFAYLQKLKRDMDRK